MKANSHIGSRDTRNTNAVTMNLARHVIASADTPRLQQIACDLERGLKHNLLNHADAKFLLGKVRVAIAHRYFQ